MASGNDAIPGLPRVAWIALAVAAAMRIHNAFAYTPLWGFDALYNWRYIQHLTHTWVLPAPDAAWSTAHPPLFYYASALLVRALPWDPLGEVIALRLCIAAVGLSMAWLSARCVARVDPGRPRRALLAFGLVLFLPVHVYMSAMVNEEILAAALVSMVLAVLAGDLAVGRPLDRRRALLLGAVAGAARRAGSRCARSPP